MVLFVHKLIKCHIVYDLGKHTCFYMCIIKRSQLPTLSNQGKKAIKFIFPIVIERYIQKRSTAPIILSFFFVLLDNTFSIKISTFTFSFYQDPHLRINFSQIKE